MTRAKFFCVLSLIIFSFFIVGSYAAPKSPSKSPIPASASKSPVPTSVSPTPGTVTTATATASPASGGGGGGKKSPTSSKSLTPSISVSRSRTSDPSVTPSVSSPPSITPSTSVSATVTPTFNPTPSNSPQVVSPWVQYHNNFRSTVSPLPSPTPLASLAWDNNLAQVALQYALTCPSDHNGNRGTQYQALGGSGSVGENLAWHTSSSATILDAMNLWYNEKTNFNLCTNTCASNQVCGHYTQLIWGDTTRIGCAQVWCDSLTIFSPPRAGYVFVCNYNTAGNYVGQAPYDTAGTCV